MSDASDVAASTSGPPSFVERRYRCFRCGTCGDEDRGTTADPTMRVYRLRGTELLIPFCGACPDLLVPEDRGAAVRMLIAAVNHRDAPSLLSGPVHPYVCSVPRCASAWFPLLVPLPFEPVFHPASGRQAHPCPWCVRDTWHEAAVAHAALRLARETHFAMWERELTG